MSEYIRLIEGNIGYKDKYRDKWDDIFGSKVRMELNYIRVIWSSLWAVNKWEIAKIATKNGKI